MKLDVVRICEIKSGKIAKIDVMSFFNQKIGLKEIYQYQHSVRKDGEIMTIGKKMHIYFGCCGLIPFIVMAVIAYNSSSKALRGQAENNLTAVREIKKNQVQDYFANRENDLITLSANPSVVQATEELINAYELLGGSVARDLYIARNPYPAGKKLELVDAGDESEYTHIHKLYHPMFKEFLERYGYHDIFIINNEGDIIYTVYKEDDFGTNISRG